MKLENGIVKAQKETKKTNAFIVPKGFYRENDVSIRENNSGEATLPIERISFDVAISAENGTTTKGSINVLTGLLNLRSDGETEKQKHSISNIKFTIPIVLPQEKIKKD